MAINATVFMTVQDWWQLLPHASFVSTVYGIKGWFGFLFHGKPNPNGLVQIPVQSLK